MKLTLLLFFSVFTAVAQSNSGKIKLYAINIKSFENTEILNSTTYLQKNNRQAIIN